MKKLLPIIVVCLLISSYAEAQKRERNHERIKSLRIAFITDKLQLTPDESEKFWPLYNEYEGKRNELRKAYRNKKNTGELTDDEAEKQILSNLDSQEKLIALKRSYYGKLKNILPIKKLARLEKVEQEFKQVIMKEMQKRRAERKNRRGN